MFLSRIRYTAEAFASVTDDRAARAHQDSVDARLKAEREAAYVAMEHARADTVVLLDTVDKLFDEHEKRKALRTQVDHALADLGTVKSAVQKQAIATKLDELEVKRRASYDASDAIERAGTIERQRIDALPASCFTDPPPADCKIPPAVAEGFWRTAAPDVTSGVDCKIPPEIAEGFGPPAAPDDTSERVSRATE